MAWTYEDDIEYLKCSINMDFSDRTREIWERLVQDAKLGAAFRRVAPLIYQMRDDHGGNGTSVNLETHGYEHNIYAATVLEAVEELARQVKE